MKKLTKEFNRASVRQGESFKISLEGLPSAGYLWEAEVKKGDAELISKYTKGISPRDPDARIGGHITTNFTFRASQKGDHLIVATYKRPWEDEAQEIVKFRVKVI